MQKTETLADPSLKPLRKGMDKRILGFLSLLALLGLFTVLILGIQAKPVPWIKPSHVDQTYSWGRVVAERLKEKFDRTPKIILSLPTDFSFESDQVRGFLQATNHEMPLPEPAELQSVTGTQLMEFLTNAKSGVFFVPDNVAWEARSVLREAQFQHSFVVVYWTKIFPTWSESPDCTSPRPVQWECQLTDTWQIHRRQFKPSKNYFGMLLQHSQFEYVSYLQSSTELSTHLEP